MSGVRWGDPPESGHSKTVGRSKWQRVADELRTRPGQWAHVETMATPQKAAQIAYLIRADKYPSMPAVQFEAVSRAVEGKGHLYARYVGEG